MPPRIAVRDIAFFERPVHFVRPFRFGAVVINDAPQMFVRVEIEIEGKGNSIGAGAEMLVPKWFDKRPHLTPEQTVAELRRSLLIARDLYLSRSGFETAFGLHLRRITAQVDACAQEDIPPLAAAYGPAEIDKAILDALLRALGVNFFYGMNGNIAGIDASLSLDLVMTTSRSFLPSAGSWNASRSGIPSVSTTRSRARAASPMPGKIPARVISSSSSTAIPSGCRAPDSASERNWRPCGMATRVTLDANEQYADLAALRALVDRLDRDSALQPIAAKLLYIEQPMPREVTRQSPLGALGERDFIIDEADDSYDAFPAARALGYRGISSKSCKGIYKSIVNATRAAKWSAGGEKFFITGEDLTCQAGLGVQQDLALGALIGVTHAERNGHHYVDGFGDAPVAEAEEPFCRRILISMRATKTISGCRSMAAIC